MTSGRRSVILFDRVSTTSATRTEQTFAETFTIVGVVRERDENDDRLPRLALR